MEIKKNTFRNHMDNFENQKIIKSNRQVKNQTSNTVVNI